MKRPYYDFPDDLLPLFAYISLELDVTESKKSFSIQDPNLNLLVHRLNLALLLRPLPLKIYWNSLERVKAGLPTSLVKDYLKRKLHLEPVLHKLNLDDSCLAHRSSSVMPMQRL